MTIPASNIISKSKLDLHFLAKQICWASVGRSAWVSFSSSASPSLAGWAPLSPLSWLSYSCTWSPWLSIWGVWPTTTLTRWGRGSSEIPLLSLHQVGEMMADMTSLLQTQEVGLAVRPSTVALLSTQPLVLPQHCQGFCWVTGQGYLQEDMWTDSGSTEKSLLLFYLSS